MVNLHEFILKATHFKTLQVDEVLFARYQCLVDEERSVVWSHTHYLAYVLNGEKSWEAGGRTCRLGPGQALFVRKGAHTVYQYFQEPFFTLFIFLPDAFIREVLDANHSPNGAPLPGISEKPFLFPIEIDAVLHAYFQSLLAHFLDQSRPSKALVRLKLKELLLNLAERQGSELTSFLLALACHPEDDIAGIMEAHFREPFSLAEFAKLSNRSLSTFRRDFKRNFQTTPAKWLKRRRLDFAFLQLQTTHHPVGEVFLESGFTNRSHFMRSFREAFGKPPGAFRKAD